MITHDEFRRRYESGGLVFLIGAGASYDSNVPMPNALLEASADAFLPTNPKFAPYRQKVLRGASIGGSEFEGIQPEVFYEQLLTLHPGTEVLNLWRALSPAWLEFKGITVGPNPNHLALVQYARRTGIPLFTTNFDDLLERAATTPAEVAVELPGADRDRAIAVADGELTPGKATIFKVHGSIVVDGREALDSLRTTMVSITARNTPVLTAIGALLRTRRLVLLGYSGSDIDIYPSLADMGAAGPPFWFNPLNDGLTAMHADRMKATILSDFPLQVLRALEPSTAAWTPSTAINYGPHFAELGGQVRDLLGEAQKILLLAMCLHGVGYNGDAETLLSSEAQSLDQALSPAHRALRDLTLARILDCTSKYDDSIDAAVRVERTAESFKESEVEPSVARALRVRARYQIAQSRQQAIGPMIGHGDPAVDWRPPTGVMIKAIAEGFADGLRLTIMSRGLNPRAQAPSEAGAAIRALHAVDDHWLLVLGRIISAADAVKVLRFPFFRAPLAAVAHLTQAHADRLGDYFAYAGAQKYIDRLGRRFPKNDAGRTYKLLRDPLNYALAKRDEGSDALRKGGPDSLRSAKAAFVAALGAARACGSPATELKALVGLVACGVPPDPGALQATAARIQGAGYASYASFLARLESGT